MLPPDTAEYSSLVFDCDGVLLDSNRVKTEAFYQAALPYGHQAAKRLVDHHTSLGGVSRYEKFRYFLESIVPAGSSGPDYESLLTRYAESVQTGLLEARVATGLRELRSRSPSTPWIVVSGSDQRELRQILKARGLADLFVGVFGSPDTKHEILQRELDAGTIDPNALFLGDSRYDHEAAKAFGLDFVFVSGWTEFATWREYCATHDLPHVREVSDLLAQ